MSTPPIESGQQVPVCIITGGNSGIGKAAAVGIAKKGFHTVIVARDEARGRAAKEEIQSTGGSGKVDLVLGDLGSLDATRRLAGDLLSRYDRIDVLINNAGLWNSTRTETPDGLEITFAVNHLAHFLLTNFLLNRIKDSAPSRIINVSSALHRDGSIDFLDLQAEHSYGKVQAYSNSKLCNMAIHPRIVATPRGFRGDRQRPPPRCRSD
jgi:retinol dehydrogenase-12